MCVDGTSTSKRLRHASAFALAALLTTIAFAGGGTREAKSDTSAPQRTRPVVPHLDSALARIAATARAHGSSSALTAARTAAFATSDGLIRVIVEPSADAAAAARAVTSVGGTVEQRAGSLLEALVPPDALAQLAANPATSLVRQPDRPFPVSVTDEAVAETGADAWQTAGYDGSGVTIAIIDLGFAGLSSAQVDGDLPASGPQLATNAEGPCVGTSLDGGDGGTSHGTAVAELVHKMAPGADLDLICIGLEGTEIDLHDAEQQAIADGAEIVNHSVAWLDTSRGDGTGYPDDPDSPDATVADARSHGILWVNAAGNYATEHWSGDYTADSTSPDLNDFHGAGTTEENVSGPLPNDEVGCAYLKWDDWPLSSEDFDLLLVDTSTDEVVAYSDYSEADLGPDTPLEWFCYQNTTGSPEDLALQIVRWSASGTPRLDLFWLDDEDNDLQFQAAGGSVSEPASSPEAFAVGAYCEQTPGREYFSSQGPTVDGRTGVDLLAPDSVSTDTYGPATAGCISGFAGTSASSPQVAGAAADLLSKDSSLSPAGLEAALEETSLDADSGLGGSPSDADGYGPLQLGSPDPSTPSDAPANSAPPTVTGEAVAGQYLQATTGDWSPVEGTAFTFSWRRCNSSGGVCSAVGTEGTDSSYLLQESDAGSTFRIQVTADDGIGSPTVETSGATSVVKPAPPTPTALPTLSGTYASGHTLSVDSHGTWTDPSPTFTYQWRRCDSSGTTCRDISGQTGSSYTLTGADVGNTVRLAVTATNADGESNVAASALIPGTPTGVSATAGTDGATVSFTAPTDGVPVTSYTVTSSPGSITATGSSSPITITGLTAGQSYRFTVTASNGVGDGAESALSNAVTPSAGGGGSGGGGGGGGLPNLHVAVSAVPVPAAVGETFTYRFTLTNPGGVANATTLVVTLPSQVVYAGSRVDRGPGCVASGQTVSCFLDFFAPGQLSTELISARVVALGSATLTTRMDTHPQELRPSDSELSYTLAIGAGQAGSPSPAPGPRPALEKASSPALLHLSGLKTIRLQLKRPALAFTLKLSKPTRLTITLRARNGNHLASWHKHAKQGSHPFKLLLPPKAKHAGHDTLQILEPGLKNPKTFTVTLTK
jgi:Subtilase family/Fibronectin type III domain